MKPTCKDCSKEHEKTNYLHMKKTWLISIVSAILFCFCQSVSAQDYIPLVLTGFNIDPVYDSDENLSNVASLDARAAWAYYSAGIKTEGALPQNLTSSLGVEYQLASFQSNNVLRIGGDKPLTGELTLVNQLQANELWVLGVSSGGTSTVKITVNYTDGSSMSPSEQTFLDWYQETGEKASFYGLGRIGASGADYGKFDPLKFCLFELYVKTDPEKTVKSVSFSYEKGSSATSSASIFAVSAYTGEERAENTLFFVTNAHLDTQWCWTVKKTIDEYVPNTLTKNFDLFENTEHYKFNFEGAIKYMFTKEYNPDLYVRLKEYVNTGRWHISGASVDANDVMVPSAESIIRNFLYGTKFYKKEFGVRGGYDVMLPDCFGFPYTLPTLAAHCGQQGFHTQKLSWNCAYKWEDLPAFGRWQGVDDSQIYFAIKPGAYVELYNKDMSVDMSVLNECNDNKNKLGVPWVFRYTGVGDQGGAMPGESAEWLDKSVNGTGPVKVKVANPDDFFNAFTPAQRDKLPVWNNELPMKVHGTGCYTSHAILKYWNRKNELLADATEKSSVIADWLGALPYQSDIIRDSWIRVIWHQFHDDLTGTSTPVAYSYTYNDHVLSQLDFSKTLNSAVGAVARQMNTEVTGIPLVVYNPLSIERKDMVEASVAVAREPAQITVYDPSGTAIATQKLSYENGTLKFLFAAAVPSLGYSTYELRLDDNTSVSIPSTLSVTANSIENDEYVVTINANGDVASIKDKKQSNKELLKAPVRMELLHDKPGFWPAWEIVYDDVRRTPYGYVDANVKVTIAEQGPLRSSLKITRSKEGSEFVQYVSLTSQGTSGRIDFVNEVDWQTRKTLMKVAFPFTASNPKATFDLSIGAIERGNRTENLYEVPGHQWADLTDSDDSYGVSILNDCKYGWDKPDDNTIRLTLIHTPETDGSYVYAKNQDLGLNKFTYSLYRHIGKWNEKTQWEASKLNQPLIAYVSPKHGGNLGKSFETLSLNTDKVAIKAFKKAEDSDEMIVRVYELTGNPQNNVQITFPANVISAKELNGVEEDKGPATFNGNQLVFDITKFQPKTFAVKLENPADTSVEASSIPVSLPYNADVMSYDTKKKDGQLGVSGYAYPAELIPDKIIADGISFTVGDRADGKENAVRCEGQKITLPPHRGATKLYLLAAGENLNGSEIEFGVDGVKTPVKVEYYGNYVGQWGTVYAEQFYRRENVAHTCTHSHDVIDNQNEAYRYMYMFKYLIPVPENATTLTLPNDGEVYLFAATLSDNENDNLVPVTKTYYLPEYEYIQPNVASSCGELLTPFNVSASGYTNSGEAPRMAADNNPFTKWCDNTSPQKWLEYEFPEEVEICRWSVTHAGVEKDIYGEGEPQITVDFKIQYYDANNTLVTLETISNNQDYVSSKELSTPVRTKKVRLVIDKGEQGDNNIARIYSFDVFGKKDASLSISAINTKKTAVYNYPNPFRESTTIYCYTPVNARNIRLSVFNIKGMMIDSSVFPVATSGNQELTWINKSYDSGFYSYSLEARNETGKTVSNDFGKMIIINK
ncbi:alpha-mannosidase [Bacteroidia bacterium]|nr:alpha-mannosidase [Bacteroidia bacterium]